MTPIAFEVARSIDAAGTASDTVPGSGDVNGGSRYVAGGTNLLDLMKADVMRPQRLVDINKLALDGIETTEGGGLMLGAMARNADTAYHPMVRTRFPVLSAAILAGASPQIRNMATNGGNLFQRTRCYYFYDTGVPCNKRIPGSGCAAIGQLTRQHAILGASAHCIATHPSDMCVALAALDARVHVRSTGGAMRVIPFDAFHRLPGDTPELDTTLGAGDLVTHIELPSADAFAAHSSYLKIRERASYAFALVSVAAMLDIDDGGTIRGARVAIGSVAHKPWRLPDAEALLTGTSPTPENFALVADALLRDAVGQGANDFKIPMARRAVVRALEMAAAGIPSNTGQLAAESQTERP